MSTKFLVYSAAVGGLFILLMMVSLQLAISVAPPSLSRALAQSPVVVDYDGEVIRSYLSADQTLRMPAELDSLPEHYLEILLSIEDKRFYQHVGVDPIAIVRAGYQLFRQMRIVSGASTLTMQLANLLERSEPKIPGTGRFSRKWMQILKALRLERHYTKRKILELYLTLAPYGGNIEGIRAASLTYFGKEPAELTLAEVVLLIGIPQAPEARRLDRFPERAKQARDHLLEELAERNVITKSEMASALKEPVKRAKRLSAGIAPHFSNAVRKGKTENPIVHTTLDAHIQVAVTNQIKELQAGLEPSASVAVLIVRNQDRSVAAYVSGADLFSAARSGHVDLVTAIRSPGSALKPFIYGMAFEELIVHPDTIITDNPVNFSGYAPKNFSNRYSGDMNIRDALNSSINTAAVAILNKVTPLSFLSRFRSFGLPLHIIGRDVDAGLAIALGGVGTSLHDLVTYYAALANHGDVKPLKYFPDQDLNSSGLILNADAAWAVSDILADAPPPRGMVIRRTILEERRIAYKTGTSYGFRDTWAIGYDRTHTVGVWIGRPDGAPIPGQYAGITTAPVLFQLFDLLPTPQVDVAGPAPTGTSLIRRSDLPKRLKYFGGAKGSVTYQPLKIIFPATGSRIASNHAEDNITRLEIEIEGGSAPFYLLIDGRIEGPATERRKIKWQTEALGDMLLQVLDANGASAISQIRIIDKSPK